MSKDINVNITASDGSKHRIETYFSIDVMGCASVDGKHIIEGCSSHFDAYEAAKEHIESEINQ